MPVAARKKRGVAAARMAIMDRLRPLLRAAVDPERMLRSVTSLLAVEIGQYCIADVSDRRGSIRRLDIEHADVSRRPRLRIICEDTQLDGVARVGKLFTAGGTEIHGRVTDAIRTRHLTDVVLLKGESVRSYMAAAVPVTGSTMAIFTLVTTHGPRRYGEDDLAFLRTVAEWTGLGVENALRREHQPKRSLVPAAEGRISGVWSDESPSSTAIRSPLRR
jgi:GAF domain-containing protein